MASSYAMGPVLCSGMQDETKGKMMIRRLGAAGVALALVVAVSGVMAASASAAVEFAFKSDGPTFTELIGEAKKEVYSFNVGNLECERTIYFGSQASETAGFLIVEPLYEQCTLEVSAGVRLKAEVHVNNCTFQFLQDNNTGGGKFDAITIIACPEGEEITVTALSGGVTKCTIHIPEQSRGTGAVFTNGTKTNGIKDYKADINLTAIAYSQTAGTGPGKCPTEDKKTNGLLTATPTFSGRNGIAEETNIWLE
jgi:hypothetical protein